MASRKPGLSIKYDNLSQILKKFVIAAAMLAAAGMAFAKTKIVTTIFPEYDWVREIAGDKAKDAEITLLIDSGIDLHSYQPSVKDITKSVCQIESGNGKIARTIIKSSKKKNAKIMTLDSMQSTTKKDIKKGTTYLSVMQKNLEVLKEALK